MGQLAELESHSAELIPFPGTKAMTGRLKRMVQTGPLFLRIHAGPCFIEIMEPFDFVDEEPERIEFSSKRCHAAILKPARIGERRGLQGEVIDDEVVLTSLDGSSYATLTGLPPLGGHVRPHARKAVASLKQVTMNGQIPTIHPVHELIERYARNDRSQSGLGISLRFSDLRLLLKTGTLALEGVGEERVIVGKSIRMRIGNLIVNPASMVTDVNDEEIALTWPGGSMKMYSAGQGSLLAR
jgi:hypothetical protein